MSELENVTSLEEAMRKIISLGVKDPVEIARKCADLYGGQWVATQLAARWEEILAEIARHALGNERRAAVVSLSEASRERQGRLAKRDAVLTSLFIPSRGWIALGDATRADLAEAEEYRRKMADGLLVWADFYRDCRLRLEEQNVERVRQLRGALPPLPGRTDGKELSA